MSIDSTAENPACAAGGDFFTCKKSMNTFPEDMELAKECLSGMEEAWERIHSLYHSSLASLLISRGATPSEAEDLLAEFWMDLAGLGRSPEPLLERFQGTGTLKSWFGTVVMNRFIARRRRKRLMVDLGGVDAFTELLERTAYSSSREVESDLAEAMRESLLKAWRKCPPEFRVMLQLLHLEAITQREIAALWGWHESKVSRALESTLKGIRRDTLANFKALDPESGLRWRDFVELGNLYETFRPSPVHESPADFVSRPCEAVH